MQISFNALLDLFNGSFYLIAGKPFDAECLRTMTAETAQRVKGWCRVLYADATLACFIGTTVTLAFLIAGAAVLRPAEIAPDKSEVAIQLSTIFSGKWGVMGARLFMLAGLAAMISTLIGLFAGWPRLLADCARILFPPVAKIEWKWQFRVLILYYAIGSMVFINWFGFEPVLLVKAGAITDGLLLTPLQALAVGLVMYTVLPKHLSEEARRILKPSPIFAIGLALAFVLFSYFCIFQVPRVLMN